MKKKPRQYNFLIIGANSFIGQHFIDALKEKNLPFTGLTRNEFDFLSPKFSALNCQKQKYSHALISAACAKLGCCENDPKQSYQVNVKTPILLAKYLMEHEIKPIFFSSDYVFDGKTGNYTETSPLSPLNYYGKQKAELEEKLPMIIKGDYLLLRLSKIFSHQLDLSLLDEMVVTFLNKDTLRVASDQVFSPLSVYDLNALIFSLIEKNAQGLFNIGGRCAISRYSLAKLIAKELEVSPRLIQKISLDDLDETFTRPKNTFLNTDKIYELTGHNQTPLTASIYRCSQNRKS